MLGFYEPVLHFNKSQAELLQSLIDFNRYRISEVLSLLPQTCEEFLQVCMLGRARYPNCKGLFRPLLTTHGLCCAFNSKYHYSKHNKRNELKPNFVSRMVSASSSTNAFTMVVDYNPADAVDATVLNAGGIRVLFTDHTEFPADDVSNLVLTNTETFHIIHATHTYCSEDVKLLPESSRKCYLPHERRLRFFREYHNSDCDHLCLVEMVRQECGCEMFYVPGLHVTNTCNVSSIDCITETKLQQHRLQPSLADCACMRDCESRRYAVEVSTGNLHALPHMFTDVYSDITFNKSTAIMHFFFSKSVYVKQKQETVISVITLVSNLGGVFGLCVGCSAMSLVEIFFYMHTAFKNYIRIRIRKHNNRVVSLK